MRAPSTLQPTYFSKSHIKPLSYHGHSSSWRRVIATGIRISEAQQSHFDRIRRNIYGPGSQDCEDASQIQADNAALVLENLKAKKLDKKRDYIAYIRWMLSTFDDGRISASPYDTAWVALVENVDGKGSPQFPLSLQWIAQNQLSDGSWGDENEYCVYDRLLNTLACLIALRSWNMHPHQTERGTRFVKENITKLESTNLESFTCGFEIIFPPLLQKAQNLGIDIPYDASFLGEIFALRDLKLARIPEDIMHEFPTPILYNLEGIEGLNWEKLLKLQTEEGSFLTSPSATAFAFMETGDKNCFNYVSNTVAKFNGGAPTVYPIDLFARLWAVDRLQRLGISHIFQEQIMECLNYVHRFWGANGVFSGRNAGVCDLDDTSMAFRLLRLQGYDVSPDVFEHFKSDDKFLCLGGELNASPTTSLNLYKASQVRFPGENVLEDAKNFSYNFLKERMLNNESLDKWVRSKDVAGELKFGLEIPWFGCLPRVEARYYIEQYGGADDVWVGKTLYRVTEISNNQYLEVAKLDFNECQIQHELEWVHMLRWWEKFNLKEYGLRRETLLVNYFLAAASIFEPRKSTQRNAWAKSWAIIQLLRIYYDRIATTWDKRSAFLGLKKGVNPTP